RHLDQLYKQIWKDVVKHRVLVVPSDHPAMDDVLSSPFNAVDKMLPDRTIAVDKRIVHDQRGVNALTDKELHPPAIQLKHEQIARLVLWNKARAPKVPDAALFAGDLPWDADGMEPGGKLDGPEMTVIYLVSSFGFSGSVWGKATEDFLRGHGPAQPRRDLTWSFDSRILVDDNVLVEPWVGLRPWVAGEVYEIGVKTMLGE
ncbi:unnamed protein product, partial [Symbiodinium pilosum]